MIIGSILFAIVRTAGTILYTIFSNPILLFKVSVLWFVITYGLVYLFFLVTYRAHLIYIRQDIALVLARSLVLGFVVACLLEATYEFFVIETATSKFFQMQQAQLWKMTFLGNQVEWIYQRMSLLTIAVAAFFSMNYMPDVIQVACLEANDTECSAQNCNWVVLIATLLCSVFLYTVVFGG
jgi:hypothetical protein